MRSQAGIRGQRGFALLVVMALLVAGLLFFIVTTLGPGALAGYRTKKTEEALAQARDALLGYAVQYRDQQIAAGTDNAVYGYLPLPDVGSTRNNNAAPVCHLNGNPAQPPLEGCDAARFTGILYDVNGMGPTVVGRLPWRTLGIEPIRDGYGECLWLMIASSHGHVFRTVPAPTPPAMNWDTLGQLDVVVADGAASLKSIVSSPHDRPLAIIFSAGPPLPAQDRSTSDTDDVAQCGGNYDPKNYLDPNIAGSLRDAQGNPEMNAIYFDGSVAKDTSARMMAVATSGIQQDPSGILSPNACPTGTDCPLVANDVGMALTPDALFGTLRKNAQFRTDINALIERVFGCLRDRIAADGAFVHLPGKLEADACYDDAQVPRGYFSHWREMLFASTVAPPPGCRGLLIFANQRNPGQRRSTAPDKADPANYLENGFNLSPHALFASLASGQGVDQDITRCIPENNTAALAIATSPGLQSGQQLASYDPGTHTLTLGRENITTNDGFSESSLFGCAWTPEATAAGHGVRSYFRLRFMGLTGGVGNNGVTFAIVDGERNGYTACGAGGTHLGYSGNNGMAPSIVAPKVGIEFDQTRNATAVTNALNSGRNDPCGISSCGGTVGYSTHSAILYWGNGSNAFDDNVHGYPPTGSQDGMLRPDPLNPVDTLATAPGIDFVDYRPHEDADGDGFKDSYLYHVRVEFTPVAATTVLDNITAAVVTNIATDSPGTTADGVDLKAGNRVLLVSQTVATENGVYVWHGATVPLVRATDADSASKLSDAQAVVTDGLHRGIWRQLNVLADLTKDAQRWQPAVQRFRSEAWIERDSATSSQLIRAMQDTTHSMHQLYSGQAPRLSDTATVFSPAEGSCGTGCPEAMQCGSDNQCYRQPFRSIRLGFTNSQRTQDQRVIISDFFSTWIQ